MPAINRTECFHTLEYKLTKVVHVYMHITVGYSGIS